MLFTTATAFKIFLAIIFAIVIVHTISTMGMQQ